MLTTTTPCMLRRWRSCAVGAAAPFSPQGPSPDCCRAQASTAQPTTAAGEMFNVAVLSEPAVVHLYPSKPQKLSLLCRPLSSAVRPPRRASRWSTSRR